MTTRKRILLAEDDTVAAEYLVSSLKQMGFDVSHVVNTGEQAIMLAQDDKPDLILMDITLEGKVDGISAAHTLHGHIDTPVIYLTGNTDDHTFQLAKLTEPYAYLVKPFDLSQLQHAIELALFKHSFEKRLRESENRYRTIFDADDNALLMIDHNGLITMVNEAFEQLIGMPRDGITYLKDWRDIFDQEDHERIHEHIELNYKSCCGLKRHIEARITDVYDRKKVAYINIKRFPGTDTMIISMTDITELKRAEDEIRLLNEQLNTANHELKQEIQLRERVERQLRHKATHDHLTGLPNRVLLFDRMRQSLAFEARHNSLLAIMIVDLDNFKTINDTLGHLSGDILLKKVAQELQKCMRQYDTVGRMGGDEFVIVVNDVNSVQDVITFAEKIKSTFQHPFDINGRQVQVTTSIGVAIYPLHGTSIEELLKKADIAMYAAKQDGRNTFRFFYEAMDTGAFGTSLHRRERRATIGIGSRLQEFLVPDTLPDTAEYHN